MDTHQEVLSQTMDMPTWRRPGIPEAQRYYRRRKDFISKISGQKFWELIARALCLDDIAFYGKKDHFVLKRVDPIEDGVGICQRCSVAKTNGGCPVEMRAITKWTDSTVSPNQQQLL